MNRKNYRLLVLALILFQSSFFESTLYIFPSCDKVTNLCDGTQNCLIQAQQKAHLKCNIHNYWYKKPDIFIDFEKNDEYSGALCTEGTQLELLVINSLKSTDSGYGIYWAAHKYNNSINCSYDIFVWDNMQAHNITFNDVKLENGTESVEVSSFENSIAYEVRVEALPLSKIIVNHATVPSDECNSTSYPWLKCLKSSKLDIKASKCSNTVKANFTYEFDNENIYSELNLVTPHFSKIINLKYPPQVSQKTKNLTYIASDNDIKLICEVECANPDPTKYLWSYKNGSLIKEIVGSNELTFSLESDTGNDIEIYCKASNGVFSSDEMDRIDFSIKFINNPTTRTTGLESWEIVLIVVCIVVFILFVIGTSLTVILITKSRKRRSEEKTNLPMRDNVNMNTDLTDRKTNLDNGLTDNPIYGSRQSVVTSHSL